MDHTHFGLTRRPFRPTPDTDLYFASPTHAAAVQTLADAFVARDGLALIDGDPGTGKTLAVLRFLAGLPADVPTAFIPAPRFTRPADLFQAILFDLGAAYQGLTEQELRLAVADRLLGGLAADGGPTVVVLDEAQHLTADILEEIRLLGNLESRAAKAAFVVLCGSPALRARLGSPESAGLAQRISARSRVAPLLPADAAAFVRHQIKVCGGDPGELLTDEALDLLTIHGGGVPRLLNQAAGLAFALAAAAGESAVDAEPVLEALVRLGLAAAPDEGAEDPIRIAVHDEAGLGDEAEAEAVAVPPARAAKAKGRKRRAA